MKMTSKKHKYRMESVGFYADPKMLSVSSKLALEFNDNKSHKEFIEKAYKKFLTIFEAQCINGSGLEIDKTLRFFLSEYNGRNSNYGLNSMPCSFNVMEAFFEHRPDIAYFKLRDENDHLFMVSDFFDFMTSPDNNYKTDDISGLLQEGVIYSYNSFEDIEDFVLSSPQKEQYVISGVSIIRFADELNILAVIGKKADISIETSYLNQAVINSRLSSAPEYKREAVEIEKGSKFWRHIVLARFDLSDKTQDTRYILADCGDYFDVKTDDINILLDESGNKPENFNNIRKEFKEYMNANSFVFELCKNLVLLPAYFKDNDDNLEFEQFKTGLWGKIGKIAWKKKSELLENNDKIASRQVTKLRKSPAIKHNIYSVGMTPEFKMQSSGYWKMLPVGKVGTDKNNNPISGRTWVTETTYWVEQDENKLDIITGTSLIQKNFVNLPNSGFIYIMRSSTDKEGIFKIGLTRRSPEQRAKEISSATGVPTNYLVIEDWPVADCVLAEKIIHQRLGKYRINNRREFFSAPYKDIRKCVDSVVENINNTLSTKNEKGACLF